MGIAQITGDDIECADMWGSLIAGKACEAFQCSSTNMYSSLALNVECQLFTVRRQA